MDKHCAFIFILCFLCTNLSSQSSKNDATVILKHTLDNEEKLIALTNWQLYYGNHLSANEMNKLPNKDKHYIYNPHSWVGQTVNGKKLPYYGIATYYLKIRNTGASIHHPIGYGLYVGNIESAYKLFVDNKLMGEGGKAGKNKENFRPFSLPCTYYFLGNADSIDVVVQVSNFILPRFGGFTQNIYFGKLETVEPLRLGNSMLNSIILGFFMLVFIQQITLIFINKLEKSHIVLSSLCFLFFIKLIADSNALMIFQLIFDDDIKLYYQIWTLSQLSIPLILMLLKIAFPNEVNPYIERAIYILYILFTLVVITLDLESITKIGYIFVFISSICLVYFNIILIRAIIARRKYAIVHTISLTILIMSCVYDIIHTTSSHSQGYPTLAGMGIYLLIQSSTFSFKLTISNKQNIKRSQNLKQLNVNLESAVKQRTKELQIANIELSNNNKQKDFLISTISHDLMNSFNVLLNFPRLLYQDKSLSENHRSTIHMIYKAAENGHSILENMLEWTKLHITHKANLKPVTNLSTIVNQNLELQTYYIQRKKLQIETEINDTLLFLCHEEQLSAILRNLISNAIKFSHEGGTIRIKNKIKNGRVQILIIDRGIGMSSKILKSLFSHTNIKKRLGTQDEKGAGIGLLIIKNLVDNNNGQINCYSKQNKNTVFIVEFKLLSDNEKETDINYR